MTFSNWLEKRLTLEGKKAQPVQMPKEISNKLELKPVKDRVPGGRKNTTFDSSPKRLRTRGSSHRAAIKDFE